MKEKLIIGSRKSKLAMAQTIFVKEKLEKFYPDIKIEIKNITTTGDKIKDVPLSKIGGKGVFTKEIEEALLNKEIDLAVHSMKDLPTTLPKGLIIGAVPERENPLEVLIYKENISLSNLPQKTIIGTSSLRRKAQLKRIRDDFIITDLRGNLETRLKKVENGIVDAAILAYAGLKRLHLEEKISQIISEEEIIPAVGQGALAIEIREDEEMVSFLKPLHDKNSWYEVLGEREILRRLGGGCQVPIAALGRVKEGKIIKLLGMIASLDGLKIVKSCVEGKKENVFELAEEVVANLISGGGDSLLKEVGI